MPQRQRGLSGEHLDGSCKPGVGKAGICLISIELFSVIV